MSISLNDDFRDIIEAFQEEEVDFLVVGAYAMAGHGYVRATGDIDLFIRRDARNAGKVLRALSRFGAPLATVSESDFLVQGRAEQEAEDNLKIPQRDAIALLEELRMLFFGSGRVDRSVLTVRSLRGEKPEN